MVDKNFWDLETNRGLSVVQQCEFLEINRSIVYYTPKTVAFKYDEDLIKAIEGIYDDICFYGHTKVHLELLDLGFEVGLKTVRNIRNLLGIKAICVKPNTTIPRKDHDKFPYKLAGMEITRPNQVWATDITYVPTLMGFAYKVAIIDIFSRKILSYRISNSMHQSFCIEALEEALRNFPKPEIFNSDQGSQFTGKKFVNILLENDIEVSMDGKGRALDNIFIERYWKSYKYENVFLKNYANLLEARLETAKYVNFYNSKRFHASLGYKTPDKIYFGNLHKSVNYYEGQQMAA
ncbi:MAG TPA: IS3 family transposase [Patescibacteria group bacterium]|nr:IS3 family transposase [Patescibacteria group bacterium]